MALPLFAQPPAEAPAKQDAAPKKEEAAAPAEPAARPAPKANASTREFRPSEEVSPDQEVDFPADL
ncbi:hypothetical protein B1810_11560 [Panacagrimonas perspica]|nr:hypothetical protein B1810_11560 [Panacagrimonas perspica]